LHRFIDVTQNCSITRTINYGFIAGEPLREDGYGANDVGDGHVCNQNICSVSHPLRKEDHFTDQ
jgi:hypothetical protein